MGNKRIVLVALYELNSLSIVSLEAALIEAGFEVDCVYFKHRFINKTMLQATEREVQLLADFIAKVQPLFVGLSIRSTFYELGVRLTEAIRKVSKCPVVWGGIHSTISPEDCIKHADYVCVGEGEGAIVDIAKCLLVNKRPTYINNIWSHCDGQIFKNELRPLLSPLDRVPFPNFSIENKYFIEADSFLHTVPQEKQYEYVLMTTRGCLFGCSFCVNNTLRKIFNGKGEYLRRRSVDNVITELKMAKQAYVNLRAILFNDDIFTFDEAWVLEFAEKYKSAIGLPFFCYFQSATMTESMIKALKMAGLMKTRMGIQSSQKVRMSLFGKSESDHKLLNAAVLLKKHRVDCDYDIILDAMLDGEDGKSDLLEFLLQLPQPFKLRMFSLAHYPKTAMTEFLLARNMITANDVEHKSKRGYQSWVIPFAKGRNRRDLFWSVLFFLTTFKYCPRFIIRILRHCFILSIFVEPIICFVRFMRKDELGYSAASSYFLDGNKSICLKAIDPKEQPTVVKF